MIYISGPHVKSIKELFLSTQPIILASTSSYRSSLLQRLRVPFQVAAPEIDETPLPGETAQQTSLRLSMAKAHDVAKHHPDALIVGSDQVALLGDKQLGKPLTHENAVRQLRELRGRCATFYTALALLNAHTGNMQTALAENHVCFRDFGDDEIEGYLQKEQPYDCAGSAKFEGLGIVLISRLEGEDPNALIGLPLIKLVTMLKNEGVKLC
jgi:7-methyl-GTP pyrophosphatase